MNRVLVSNLQSRVPPRKRHVERLVRFVLAAQGVAGGEVSVALMDDRHIRRLNRRYRGKDRPTDVLAFRPAACRESGRQPRILGDVVVSGETARRVARDREITWQEELDRYLIHGVLHLLGYEDSSARDSARLRRRQEELLRTYASPVPG